MARRAIRRATPHQTRWRQRAPPFLAFCPSDLSCEKISIARSGLDTPKQLLQLWLHFGSQMCGT
jgi:hypothetical protein